MASTVHFGGEERVGGQLDLHGVEHLAEFRLECGPAGLALRGGRDSIREARVAAAHAEHGLHQLPSGGGQRHGAARAAALRPLSLDRRAGQRSPSRPLCPDRHRAAVRVIDGSPVPAVASSAARERGAFTIDGKMQPNILYRVEESRGYDHAGTLWSPGYFRADLTPRP